MDNISVLFLGLNDWLKLAVVVVPFIICLVLLNRFLRSYWQERKFQFQLVMLCATLVVSVVIIIALPLSDTLRGQLLTFFGILLSAAVAFASTTFISNILAGFMLRAIKNIKPGDYVTVADVTGRATELNLLHVEVQTEKSDLVTIPNIHMVTHPVKVVRSTGTIVSVDVSLGYDIPRLQISKLLCLATEDAGLSNGFVQIKDLGDYSVSYRVAGRLDDISNLLSVRSNLFGFVLDRLHSENIEIVSPNFMNTRSVDSTIMIPKSHPVLKQENSGSLEKLAFEKAETASTIANIRSSITQLSSNLEDEKGSLDERERDEIESKLATLSAKLALEEARLTEDDKSEHIVLSEKTSESD